MGKLGAKPGHPPYEPTAGQNMLLYYNNARYYEPETGRYIASDPIGLLGGLNTYTYAHNNPLMYIDPQGLAVLLQTHKAQILWRHAKISIIPVNQENWASDSRFANRMEDGRIYLTLGAGPVPLIGGNLVSNLNRPTDVNINHNTYSRECPLPDQFATEDALIEALLTNDSNYQDDLDYDLKPQSQDGFNSNSYANGLLRSVGIEMPRPPGRIWGWDQPLPADQFR